jgi:ABC-type nitrate/sulfonate/bicarbonate transport system permease component
MVSSGSMGKEAGMLDETISVPDPLVEEEWDRPPPERRWLEPALGFSTIVVLVVLWQWFATAGYVDEAFTSRPTSIAVALWKYVASDAFLADSAYTGETFIITFGISVVVGTAIGAVMGLWKYARYALDYIITGSYAAPRIAFIPIIVLWFGIGMKSGVVFAVLIAIYPMIMNTMTGIRAVDSGYVDLGTSLKMTQLQRLRYILLPAAVPSILTGVRLTVGLTLIGVIVAEFLASTQGVGYRIYQSAGNYEAAPMFAAVVVITLGAVIITELVKIVERRFDRWRLQ